MKRPHEDEEEANALPLTPKKAPLLRISSLQEMALQKIVSSFKTLDSLTFYLTLVQNDAVKTLLLDTWKRQERAPNHSLVTSKRRFLKASLVMEYMDVREGTTGILSQEMRIGSTPIRVSHEGGIQLLDYAMKSNQLCIMPSKQHKSLRFFLYKPN
jgi:hypothetical protein